MQIRGQRSRCRARRAVVAGRSSGRRDRSGTRRARPAGSLAAGRRVVTAWRGRALQRRDGGPTPAAAPGATRRRQRRRGAAALPRTLVIRARTPCRPALPVRIAAGSSTANRPGCRTRPTPAGSSAGAHRSSRRRANGPTSAGRARLRRRASRASAASSRSGSLADTSAAAGRAGEPLEVAQALEQELRAGPRAWRPSSRRGSKQNTGTDGSAGARRRERGVVAESQIARAPHDATRPRCKQLRQRPGVRSAAVDIRTRRARSRRTNSGVDQRDERSERQRKECDDVADLRSAVIVRLVLVPVMPEAIGAAHRAIA